MPTKHGELIHNVKVVIARDFQIDVFSIKDLHTRLVEKLPTTNYNSLYGIFSKLVKNGTLINHARGLYSTTPKDIKLESKPEPDRKLSYIEIGQGIAEHIADLKDQNMRLEDELAQCHNQLHKLQSKCNEMLQNSNLSIKDIT